MAEYIDRKELMKHISPIVYKDGYIANNMASKIVYEIQCESTADVIEREKIDKAIEDIKQTLYVDSLIFGELFDFKDGKISADDVIEEFNKVTRKEVLEILKRNIGE